MLCRRQSSIKYHKMNPVSSTSGLLTTLGEEAGSRARTSEPLSPGISRLGHQISPSSFTILGWDMINIADLVPNIAPGWDFDNNDADASNDTDPHGTACAGIIAAAVNNLGVTGIAPFCRIIPLRAAGGLTWQTWAATFDWAAKQGRVISCSWSITPNNTMSDAIRRAVNAGVTVFCATGNGGSASIEYPASMQKRSRSGGTNRDVRANYSQFGTGLGLVAPSSGGTLQSTQLTFAV